MEALDKFLEKYEEFSVKYYMDITEELNKEEKELYPANSSIKLYGQVRSHLIHKYGKGIYELSRVKLSYCFSDILNRKQTIEKMVKREVKAKKENFIRSCEKKIRKLVDTSNLQLGMNNEINGYVIGEDGRAIVETISAGGYNIQKYHYRLLVKKIK